MLERIEEASSRTVKPLDDGVYFGLDSETYHADHALGSTDIRNLLKHPADYWWDSWMNPAREVKGTDYTEWGSAFHALILEGDEAFERRYYRGPSKRDYPDLLVTMEHLRKWLSLRGYAVAGNKDVLVKRALAADPDAPVWDEIERRAEVLAEGRLVLNPGVYDTVRLSSKMITKNPHCAKAFENGYPEVSVFWTQDGVRCKARFDYLRFRAVVDLKSIRNWQTSKPFDVGVNNAIASYRLDIQAAHYMHGRYQVPRLIDEGSIKGEVSSAWLDRLVAAKAEDLRFIWVFFQAENAPIAKRVDYHPGARYHEVAQSEIGRALELYRRHLEVFGTDIWVDVSSPRELCDEDLPSWLGVGV